MRRNIQIVLIIFIAIAILVSCYLMTPKRPKIETIPLEEIGLSKVTPLTENPLYSGYGDKLIAYIPWIQESDCGRVWVINITTRKYEEITEQDKSRIGNRTAFIEIPLSGQTLKTSTVMI